MVNDIETRGSHFVGGQLDFLDSYSIEVPEVFRVQLQEADVTIKFIFSHIDPKCSGSEIAEQAKNAGA